MGKGSKPRNCFSQAFRDNHDSIDWSKGRAIKPVLRSMTETLLADYSAPTCGFCGKRMRFNVPRMGSAGGFVHADTDSLSCDSFF